MISVEDLKGFINTHSEIKLLMRWITRTTSSGDEKVKNFWNYMKTPEGQKECSKSS